jgi:hypothetical protein
VLHREPILEQADVLVPVLVRWLGEDLAVHLAQLVAKSVGLGDRNVVVRKGKSGTEALSFSGRARWTHTASVAPRRRCWPRRCLIGCAVGFDGGWAYGPWLCVSHHGNWFVRRDSGEILVQVRSMPGRVRCRDFVS